MKITSNQQNYITQNYAKAANAANGTTPPPDKPAPSTEKLSTDKINLSATTLEMQKITGASETSSPERVEKVAELKALVEANQYTVNAEEVAEKMLGSIFNGTI